MFIGGGKSSKGEESASEGIDFGNLGGGMTDDDKKAILDSIAEVKEQLDTFKTEANT
jgi:hypothetical protein